MTPQEFLAQARKDNPMLRYALRTYPAAGPGGDPETGGAVLGAFCTNAGGFIPVAIETAPGFWERMPNGYLEIDGKAVGIEPENWVE